MDEVKEILESEAAKRDIEIIEGTGPSFDANVK